MEQEAQLRKQIEDLESQLRDRNASLPAHSVRPQQMLAIEELETAIEEKKRELERLREKKQAPR